MDPVEQEIYLLFVAEELAAEQAQITQWEDEE